NISVVCRLRHDPHGMHIKVDSGQLTQVLLNVAVNARDAMPDGGRLLLETSVTTIKPAAADELPLEELKPGDYVVISVTDNGVGMSDEVKAHLFEPFFTTKEEGHASGLGLATSYGIIRQSGGHIEIESRPKKGTTVRIYFPKVKAPAVAYKRVKPKSG